MTSSPGIGEQLIRRGWQQGVVAPAAGYAVLAMTTDAGWSPEFASPSEPLEQWMIISQDCDILAQSEPYVEVMACYWSERGTASYGAARAGNSYRYYFVKEQEYEGKHGVLIVDATKRAQASKAALLELDPCDVNADDPNFARHLRRWLGGRYSRPALPTTVVDAIQRPIVNGIRKLGKNDPAATAAQELVREVRLFPVADTPPYDVKLIVLIQDAVDSDDECIAAFRGRIETWLRQFPDTVRSVNITTLQPSTMYVSEYEDTLKLPLDQYSVGAEDLHVSGSVRGIDHG